MRVAIGVCGGIAAYKAAELVRQLQQQALDVEVVMTAAAGQFIRPLTFAALTGKKVITALWEAGPAEDGGAADGLNSEPNVDSAIEHIAVAQRIDCLVVAPATADMLAKFAHGLADDFLSTLYLATEAPVVVAPAMNVNMLKHPATQANLEILRARGVRVVEPESGYLACGMVGSGRLAEPSQIVVAVLDALKRRHDLERETVLITAGGTREAIDPVRFLGNRSSGKMGYALAQIAQQRGARVTLISAPTSLTPPPDVSFVPVSTAAEMRDAVMQHLPKTTILIKAAAVADFRLRVPMEHKLKRSGSITLELEPTEDILAEASARRAPGTLVIGFAAEISGGVDSARAKLERKGADAIVLNDISRPGIGFDSDRNAVAFLTSDTAIELPEMPKLELADRLLDEIVRLRRPSRVMRELPETARVSS